MEVLGIVSVPGWLITATIIVLTLYLYSKWKLSFWKRLGVAGPKPMLYVGNMLEYYKKGLPYTELEYVKKYGPVVGIYQCHQPTLLLTDPELIKEIFIKQFSYFTNRKLPVKPTERALSGVAIARDTHWKYLRSTMSATFTSGKLKTMMEKIHKCCKAFVENIDSQRLSGGHVNMNEKCGAYTMDVISSTAFGMDVNSQKEPNNNFLHFAKRAAIGELPTTKVLFIMMFPFLKPFISVDLGKKDVAAFFKSAVEIAVKLRQDGKQKYTDFLQLMLNARHDDSKEDDVPAGDLQEYKNRGFNHLELQQNALTFFLAGYDTTANTLAFASYCLATNTDIQDKVIDETDTVLCGELPKYDSFGKLPYLDMFLSEVLRLYAVASRFNRECSQDIDINGLHIPKGTDVSISVYSLHRDPKYWPDPEKFDPERFTDENKQKRPDYCYLPFGIGPRICLGQRLALLEAKMALVYMLQNFTFSICDETEVPVTFENSVLLRARNGVRLEVNRRQQIFS